MHYKSIRLLVFECADVNAVSESSQETVLVASVCFADFSLVEYERYVFHDLRHWHFGYVVFYDDFFSHVLIPSEISQEPVPA